MLLISYLRKVLHLVFLGEICAKRMELVALARAKCKGIHNGRHHHPIIWRPIYASWVPFVRKGTHL